MFNLFHIVCGKGACTEAVAAESQQKRMHKYILFCVSFAAEPRLQKQLRHSRTENRRQLLYDIT